MVSGQTGLHGVSAVRVVIPVYGSGTVTVPTLRVRVRHVMGPPPKHKSATRNHALVSQILTIVI